MLQWLSNRVEQPDEDYYQIAKNRQLQLTKPTGSLGILEEVAIRLVAMQKSENPVVNRVFVTVFAADHGVAEESVSAFPQVVTSEMVKNFVNQGAAVNMLSRFVKAKFEVVDVGLVEAIDAATVIVERAGHGTENIVKKAAMTQLQMQAALTTGKSAVERAIKQQAQLFIGGEMGIANTTSASAIASTLTGLTVEQLTGAGSGLNNVAILHKVNVIKSAIRLHQNFLINPLKALQYLGGFEIAALVGAYIFSAQQGLPVMIDGFIASVAALIAVKINPQTQAWFFYAHRSQEKGHQLVLEQLNARPLLDLNMRLGEGSGAILAVPLLQMACGLHNEMATFKQANITINSNKGNSNDWSN